MLQKVSTMKSMVVKTEEGRENSDILEEMLDA